MSKKIAAHFLTGPYILFCKNVKNLNHSKQVLHISSTTIRIKYAKKCNSYFKKLNHGKYSYEI